MLLATLTANLQSSYAQIQSQIEALQEQQRLIQAQLQRVGSVESKMESAAALVAEAIAEIREVCPDELGNYRLVVEGLFGSAPVAQIEGASDDIPAESVPAPITPPASDEPQAVDVAAQEVPASSQAEEQVQTKTVSHEAPAGILHKQAAKPLQWLAAKRGIDTSNMKRHQIASALVGQVTHAELEEAVAQTAKVG